jgi:hypothetical protein
VKDGFDEALVDLVDVSPQPTSEGIKPTRRTFAADGSVYDESLYTEWVFSALESVTMYQSVLTQLGIINQLTNEVTIYTRNRAFGWVRMNGIVVMPEPGRDLKWEMPFPRDIVILIKDLEPSA